MAQTSKSQTKADLVLFFDANLPKVKECSSNCRGKSRAICKHSFGFEATFLHTSHYADFLRFSDFQVILHCVFLILHNKKYHRVAENGGFFIVTKDRKFLKDAENVWKEKARPKTRPKLTFHFIDDRNGSVAWNGFKIFVKVIDCKNYGTNSDEDIGRIVSEISRLKF